MREQWFGSGHGWSVLYTTPSPIVMSISVPNQLPFPVRSSSRATCRQPFTQKMKSTIISSLYLSLSLTLASAGTSDPSPPPPANLCPQVHVFGARETTAPPGFGSAQTLVDLVTTRFPGATAEAIDYPAAPGKQYGASVAAGVAAVVAQTAAFAARCPESVIIMHGYSQVGGLHSCRLGEPSAPGS